MNEGAAPAEAPRAGAGRKGRLRRALARAALLTGSLAVALGAGEIATRLLYPPVRGVSWYHYDPRYEFKHRPDVDQETTEWGELLPWRFRTNSRGFRWPEWPDVPAPGTSRVLVMGDSFTFGNAVEVEQTFPAVAGAALRGKGGWEIVNAGVSGWGPENALAYLETEGRPIRASCLVYAFYEGNDVLDAYIHPLYALKDGGLVRLAAPAGPATRTEKVRGLMRAIPVYDQLLAHSQLFNVARNLAIAKIIRGANDARVQAKMEDPWKLSPETFASVLDATLATLDRMDALSRERFGAFALLMLPFREQALLRAPGSAPPEPQTPEWIAASSHDRVVAWANDHGVPVIDAGAAFPADPGAVRGLYFSRDFHMNAAGHQLLGRLLAERVQTACAKRAR
jgi:hypothetical protein